MPTSLSRRNLLLAVLAAAALLRLWFYLEVRGLDLVTTPLLDCEFYRDWALRLTAGDWDRGRTYWMGPLYPHLLALVYLAFGPGAQAPVVLQLGLTLLNVWLTYCLAVGLLAAPPDADPAEAERIGIGAAALVAGYGPAVFYAASLLMATLATTLFLLVALQARRAAASARFVPWFALGLLLGLAGLARGNVLLLALTLPWLRGQRAPWRQPRPWLGLGLGVALLLLPVTVRNLLVAGDVTLLTSNAGVNLLIGQQTGYGGIFTPLVDDAQGDLDPTLEEPLEREQGRDLKGSEVSRLLARRAWDEFRSHLGAMPGHYLRKAYRFWNGYELPQIVGYQVWRRDLPSLQALAVPFVLLSALGLLGLRCLPPAGRRLLVVLLGTFFVSLLPFFPTSRYRQPLVPLLAIAAACWLATLLRGRLPGGTDRVGRTRLLAVGALAVAALLPRWAALDAAAVEWEVRLHQAARAAKRGDLAAVGEYGRMAEACRPGLADTPFQVARQYEDLGAGELALAELGKAAARAPESRLVPYRQGLVLEAMGRDSEALTAFARAARLDTAWALPWHRGALILRRQERLPEALTAMRRAAALAPGHRRIRANLASLAAENGRLEEARELLAALTRDHPDYLNGWFNRAVLELQAGDRPAAAAALARAAALRGLTPAQRERIAALERSLGPVP